MDCHIETAIAFLYNICHAGVKVIFSSMLYNALSDVLHYSRLCDYHWPGNVRELRNVLERSMMLWKGGEFQLQLPVNVDARADWAVSVNGLENLPLNDITSRIVAIVCAEMVNRCNGNKTMAAKRLGISRDALYRHLKKNQDGCITHTDSHWLS